MADSDPISSATRPHGVQPAGDADRRQRDARRRRKRRRGKADEAEVTTTTPADGKREPGEDDETNECGRRGRHLDVRA